MQNNLKMIQGLISKIQSPLSQIRNRAVTTLYTKVSAKIINQIDLSKCKNLPGILFHWVNQTIPTNKDCLYKVLSILHRYTLSEEGIQLLYEYEALQFLQELRKFILSNETNVDQHVDIIKKIIKQMLPLQNQRKEERQKKDQDLENNNEGQNELVTDTKRLRQQQIDDSDNQNKVPAENQKRNIKDSKAKQIESKKQRHIIQFYCLNEYLPKAIDEQLYSLLIQLKHGKKQSIPQTLMKIEQIVAFWGWRYFKYKQDLIRQLVCIIEGRIYSEISCRIISLLIKQLLQMEEDLGMSFYSETNNLKRNYLRTLKIGDKNKVNIQNIKVEIKFQIFQDNPFTYSILDTIISKNKSAYLSESTIQYLLVAVQKFSFSAAFLPELLKKISKNQEWIKSKFSNKFYQEQFFRMVNHCCFIQSNIYSQVIPFLRVFFPGKSLQQLSKKIPNLSVQLQQEQIQSSFSILESYTPNQLSQNFDFSSGLHQLQSHLKNLQKGIAGLPKKPEVVSLYIDCMLMLAVSVARQNPFMSHFPKIKALVLKISQHQYLNCRISFYVSLLIAFNTSDKINYSTQSFLKSELIRLVFTDGQFYESLFINALNQEQTIEAFLQLTKMLQTTTKQENRKYLNKFSPIFFILSHHREQQSKNAPQNASISSAAKIILSRIPKKYHVSNILLSMFLKSKEERTKIYAGILGLSSNDDLLKLTLQYICLPEKKSLKYSLSTVKNYMNIIMNKKIQDQIKIQAIDEMIECVQRVDLASAQNDEQFIRQILTIHASVQSYIKNYLQKSQKNQEYQFFIQLVRIYSIIEKRLRLETNYLNQSIKSLPVELYLNILINICGWINEQSLKNEKFRYVIPQFMILIYYHCFTTFTSNLLFSKSADLVNSEKSQLTKHKANIKVHWITQILPHQTIIKSQVEEIASVAKRIQFSSSEQQKSIKNQYKMNKLHNFLKGYKLNMKSLKQLIQIYIQHIGSKKINLKNNNSQRQEIKSFGSILCPILERQLSNAIHNINSNQNQLFLLNFLFQSFNSLNVMNKTSVEALQMQNSQKQKTCKNILQSLQEIVPHIMNQLIKPNIPEYLKTVLISISNTIGWKRTKQFQSLVQQINPDQLYYLKFIKKAQRLSAQELSKIIKMTLNNQENLKNYSHVLNLYQIILKPSNLKLLLSSSTSEYTQLLVLNSLVKNIQNAQSDPKIVNYSCITLYLILNQIISEVKSMPAAVIVNFNNSKQYNDEQDNQNKKILELTKLTCSLSIGPNLMSFVMERFQNNDFGNNINLTLQNLCFAIEILRILSKISFFVYENQLIENDASVNHESKLIKLFLVKIMQFLKSNSQFMIFYSMEMLYTSLFNLVNTLLKTKIFNQTASQIDALDFTLIILHQKIKGFKENQAVQTINPISQETYSLLSSIFEYVYLRILVEPSESSHYLLSSTPLLQSSLNLLNSINYNTKNETAQNPYKNQTLQKLGKVLHSISFYQEDYFVFKVNQLFQDQFINFNLFEKFGNLVEKGGQNFLICFMRLILIWEGKKQQKQSNYKNQSLNSNEIFGDDQQQQDDSSIQQRQEQIKTKNSYQKSWIYKVINISVNRNHIKHCKSLLALSIPAKIFLLQKPIFLVYLKKVNYLIDKIIVQANSGKKNLTKKPAINNSSVLLSNSRRTVVSQVQSYAQQDNSKILTEEQKILQIQEYINILISIFIVNQGISSQALMNRFSNFLSKNKEVLRKIFYSIDKLYTLSQILSSSLNSSKKFSQKFLKLINALSQSTAFSLPLSSHLSQVASPMLEQSISMILKGISNQQDYQKLKQALKLLTTLSSHESVRSYIYKNKLIEQLNSKIIKYEQKRSDKKDFINLNSLYDIATFYLNLSKHKDSHGKILNDKKVLQVLINQVYMQKSSLLSERILQLLGNLCAYKSNKNMFMQNREIHKTILGQLESEQIQYKCHLLTLLYNLMYRHASAVKLYKRKDVIQMLYSIPWENLPNWGNVKHIHPGVLQVLESQFEIPDKS